MLNAVYFLWRRNFLHPSSLTPVASVLLRQTYPGLSALLRAKLGLTNPSPNTLPNIARHIHPGSSPDLTRRLLSKQAPSRSKRHRLRVPRSACAPAGADAAPSDRLAAVECKAAAQDIRPSSLSFTLQDYQPNIHVECLSPRQVAARRTKESIPN
jgi:hypothetical protein